MWILGLVRRAATYHLSHARNCAMSSTLISTNQLVQRWKRPLLLLLIGYVISYAFLSRIGAKNAREAGMSCFLYVPCKFQAATGNQWIERLHIACIYFFYPVWFVDHLLGGPQFADGIPYQKIGPSSPNRK